MSFGFSSRTGDENILFIDNISFDGTKRGGVMTQDGEIWLGSSTLPRVRKSTLTSSDSSITLTYSEPTSTTAQMDLTITGGATTTQTLTGDDGNPVSPSAGNINVKGQNTANQNGSETFRIGTNILGVRMKSPFTLEDFTFSTDTAGSTRNVTVENTDDTNTASHASLTVQSGGTSGGDPFVRFNVPSGQDYSLGIDNSDSDTLKLTDNADPSTGTDLWAVTTSSTTISPQLNVDNLRLDGNTIFSTNTNGAINLTPDGSGSISFSKSEAGVDMTYIVNNQDNTSSDSDAIFEALTGGASSGDPYITVGIDSTRAYALGIDNDDSDILKITTNNSSTSEPSGGTTLLEMTSAGEQTMPLQPCFYAYLGTTDANVTGDGTAFVLGDTDVGTALTEITDQNSDFTPGASGGAIFTAPVTGNYQFNFSVLLQDMTASHTASLEIVVSGTSADTYRFGNYAAGQPTGNFPLGFSICVPMTANDTAKFQVTSSGSTKDIDVNGGADNRTNISGFLVC